MLRNYFKIAWRNIIKNKGYSLLNVFGLAIGITCASLIFLWVENEFSFDTFIDNQDRVYILPTNQKYEGEWSTFYSTPGPFANDLKAEIPDIENASMTISSRLLFSVGDTNISRMGRYVQPDFFDIFSLKFIEGTAQKAFKNKSGLVLTQETASILFGSNQNAVGKTVLGNNKIHYIVTGVVENLPKNATFSFHWLASFKQFSKNNAWAIEYDNNCGNTFVKLKANANTASVNKKIKAMLPNKSGWVDRYAFLHNAKNWHLRSKFKGGKVVGGQITYVRLFTFIALIILVIACINFMNLATARSEKRANEVGVRKALGSGRLRLIIQFAMEALLLASIATVLSVVLMALVLPQFNILVNKTLVLGITKPLHSLVLLSITLVCGILSGAYPAFYLSSFKPVEVLKGLKKTGHTAVFIRKGLVISQFTISIVFIISTILVFQQIQFAKNRDVGYSKAQVISLNANAEIIKNYDVINQEIKQLGVAKSMTLSNSNILWGGNNGSGFEWAGGHNSEDILISFRHVTPNFFKTMKMQLIQGRDFHENMEMDSTNVLISESLAKLFGNENPIGKKIYRDGNGVNVIGVVKDYMYGNMFETSSNPVMYFNNKHEAQYVYIKITKTDNVQATIASIKSVFKKHDPSHPFNFEFLDNLFNTEFANEELIGTLSQLFALLAIFISCLGLFGLAAYTAERRSKEIGVRKVLGATVANIVHLLSSDFLKLVLVSIVFAVPIAWFVMHDWLQDYAYRISIHWGVFALAGLAAVVIALLTVSFQAIKAAISNPVKSLRTE